MSSFTADVEYHANGTDDEYRVNGTDAKYRVNGTDVAASTGAVINSPSLVPLSMLNNCTESKPYVIEMPY